MVNPSLIVEKMIRVSLPPASNEVVEGKVLSIAYDILWKLRLSQRSGHLATGSQSRHRLCPLRTLQQLAGVYVMALNRDCEGYVQDI